jgi:hypothetical protein
MVCEDLGNEEVCFPVAKKISVTNDDIAKEEQNKKEGEQ